MKKKLNNFLFIFLIMFISIFTYAKLGFHFKTFLLCFLFLISFIIAYLLNKRAILKMVRPILLCLLAISFLVICPNGNEPDSLNHFLRAYEISQGKLVAKSDDMTKVGGDYLPSNLEMFNKKDALLDKDNEVWYSFSNTAIYSPISYIPQSVGIKLASFFTNSPYILMYAGRITNMLLCLALCILAIYLIPFKDESIFYLAALPISLQEFVSLSPDGLTIALSLLFVSYILYLRQKIKITKKDMSILLILAIVLSLLKIVYIGLLFLIFLLPNNKFENNRQSYLFKTLIIIIPLILNLVWITSSFGMVHEANQGDSASEQIKYILANPFNYLAIMFRTIFKKGYWMAYTMFGGLMGSLNINTTFLVPLLSGILFIIELFSSSLKSYFSKKDLIIILITILLVIGLIFTSLYVQWTPLAKETVDGLQGRYFIPILLLMILIINSLMRKDLLPINFNNYNFYIIILYNCICMLNIYMYYL